MSDVKVVHCRDVSFDCNGGVKSWNETDLFNQMVENTKTIHNIQDVTNELVNKFRSTIREE